MDWISSGYKENLLNIFKSEKKIDSIINNYELFYLDNFTLSQIFKIYNKKFLKVFSETNSKKHLSKIYEMIRGNFFNEKTNIYLNFFLDVSNDKIIYEKRKEIFSNLEFDLENDLYLKFKTILSSIEDFKTKLNLKYKIYVLENIEIRNFLLESFSIVSQNITKKELEEIIYQDDLRDTILISEEEIFCEIQRYNKDDFIKIIRGNIIKNNLNQIEKFIELFSFIDKKNIISNIENLSSLKLSLDIDTKIFSSYHEEISKNNLKEIANRTLKLEEELENINKYLKEIISKKNLSLQGDELLELLNTGNLSSLQEKIKKDISYFISEKELELINFYKSNKININSIFANSSYPLELDIEVKEEILKQIELKNSNYELELFEKLGKLDYKSIKNLWNFAYFLDLFQGIYFFSKKYDLKYPQICEEICLIDSKNIYIKSAFGISYGLGTKNLNLNNEKITILTGANSGGKTTLLEMFLQTQILTYLGLGISAQTNSKITFFDEIIYLKKFSGTQGSGAFEQTIRYLLEILDSDTKKLILIDEFEAITEPGAAAKILIMFLKELSNTSSFCIGVSHLGLEINEFLKNENNTKIRIDGISAIGLDKEGNLLTNHQPQFYKLGKSTPELILKRILQDESFWKNKSNKSKSFLEKIVEK